MESSRVVQRYGLSSRCDVPWREMACLGVSSSRVVGVLRSEVTRSVVAVS